MRTCTSIEEKLADLLERDREGDSDRELEDHLLDCTSCAARLLRAQRLARALERLGSGYHENEDFVERILGAAPPDPPPAWMAALARAFSRRRRAMLPLAAAVALLVVGSVALLVTLTRRPSQRSLAPAAGRILLLQPDHGARAELELGSDEKRQALPAGASIPEAASLRSGEHTRARLLLADGTSLHLNRATSLQLQPGGARLLRGELLIQSPASRTFRVEVPSGAIEAQGSKLQVSADSQVATASVVRGAARVGRKGAGWLEAVAGQEVSLPVRGGPRLALAPDLGRSLAWAEGQRHDEGDSEAVGLGTLTAHPPGRTQQQLALRLAEHRVRARIEGPFARTEIEETFENPTAQTLEGVYRMALPGGARIARLALWVDGRLEEGTFVERERAGRIWRGVIRNATPIALRRPDEEYAWVPGPWKDPALLEWQQGNRFELRVFPIPPRGRRTVLLAYTESLPRTARGRRYLYPLPRSRDANGRAGTFGFEASLIGHSSAEPVLTPGYTLAAAPQPSSGLSLRYEARDFLPRGDLLIDFATPESRRPLSVLRYRPSSIRRFSSFAPATANLVTRLQKKKPSSIRESRAFPNAASDRADEYVLFSLRPEIPSYATARRRSLLLVVDRSYSTLGEVSRRQKLLVAELLAELDARDEIRLVSCDSRCRTAAPWQTATPQAGTELLRWLDEVRPGGATDLGEMLRSAAGLLAERGTGRAVRVVYIGDGTPTVGELDEARLLRLASTHLGPLGARLTMVGVGAAADAKLMEALARAAGGSYLAYLPGTSARGEALQILARQQGAVLEEVQVKLPDAVIDVAPRQLPSLHQGEELVLVGRARGDLNGEVQLSGRVNGEPFRASYAVKGNIEQGAGGAFLPRVWAQLSMNALTNDDSIPERERKQRVLSLSQQHQLLSRYTSLLVLESAAMRRAFGVVAAPAGERRAAPRPTPRVEHDSSKHDDLDDLLDSAVGGGGSRRHHELPSEPAPERVLAPPPSAANVSGSLDKEIIRRTVRQHMAGIRAVYDRALKRDPRSGGKLTVRFTIGPTGMVTAARVEGAADPGLARDLESEVRRWRFPAPAGGGEVHVAYPFSFKVAADGVSSPPAPPPRTDGRPWVRVRMRRVWYQQASLSAVSKKPAAGAALVERRRDELRQNPESRDRHRRLYQALSLAGEVEEAQRVATAWLDHEPHSREALELLAESLSRMGRHQAALRVLGSIVELEPREVALQQRMAELLGEAGEAAAACAHRLALATLTGDEASARDADDCRHGFLPRHAPRSHLTGSVRLRARWQPASDIDLDLALIDGQGRRLSWSSLRPKVRSQSATSATSETLALGRLPAGRYRLEITRRLSASDPGAARRPVNGSLHLVAPGLDQRLAFELRSQRAYLAELRIESRSLLEQAPP